MIYDQIFDSFSDCLGKIEEDFAIDLSTIDLQNPAVLLRGENYPYEKTESSMKRFLTSQSGKMERFEIVTSFIDFEDIYSDYHGKTFGLTKDEALGFLQHYGFPTDVFDFSPSARTARFFSHHGCTNQAIGTIGAFLTREMRHKFAITSLFRHPFAERPRRQVAYAARPKIGSFDLKDSNNDGLFTSRWYRFKKSKEDIAWAMEKRCEVYPTEAELAHFFGEEVDDFFSSHWSHDSVAPECRAVIDEHLRRIREQLPTSHRNE